MVKKKKDKEREESFRLSIAHEKEWLHEHLPVFLKELKVEMKYPAGFIEKFFGELSCQRTVDGRYAYIYPGDGEIKNGYYDFGNLSIPFVYARAISYLLYLSPWVKEIKGDMYGYRKIYPSTWICKNYDKFKAILERIDTWKEDINPEKFKRKKF